MRRTPAVLSILVSAIILLQGCATSPTGRRQLMLVSEDMVGHKLGEFAPSRTYYGHQADKKSKR